MNNRINFQGQGINNFQGATGGLNRGGGISGIGVSSPGGINRGITGLGISSPGGGGLGISSPGGYGGLGGGGLGGGGLGGGGLGGMTPLERQYYDQQQIVLVRPQGGGGSSGALGGALDGLDIDYDTYVLLLGLALAAGAFALYQIILTKGRRRSFTSQSWSEFAIDRLSDLVWTGKLNISLNLVLWSTF